MVFLLLPYSQPLNLRPSGAPWPYLLSKYCISFDNNGSCFFDERHIPFYLIPILFVICQLTYLILSAIIIDINIAIHSNDTKMDIRKITPLELPLLTQLFNYNDTAEMIEQNERDMKGGTIDIFVMFDNDRPIGELHAAYESDDERAVKEKRAYL